MSLSRRSASLDDWLNVVSSHGRLGSTVHVELRESLHNDADTNHEPLIGCDGRIARVAMGCLIKAP